MTFAKPIFLYLLIILLPTLAIFFWWAEKRRKNAIQKLGNPTLINRLSASVNWRGRRWKTVFWLLVLTMLLIALARPQWGSEVQMVEQEGIEVMVALDVSQSMLAQDIKPDRLSRAKMEISELMDRLGGDEVGLVLFSGASFIQFPLTSDYGTARTFLESARPEIISRPGTNVGNAIRTALSGFDFDRATQKVILLITDGEAHDADATAMAQEAADKGVLIYTIGFGSAQGEPIPQYNERGEVTGYKKDQNGEVVLTKLDEATLKQIAKIGSGQYFHATASGAELDALLNELNALQKSKLESQFETWGIERFQGFLLIALIALIASELIPDRVLRYVINFRGAVQAQ